MSKAETHNELAQQFVMDVIRRTKSRSELMVVLETVILSAMITGSKLYGIQPQHASELVQVAIDRALERFAKDQQ